MNDSLDCLKLMMAFEEAFDIEIPDSEMKNVGTMNQARELIDRLKIEQDKKKSKKKQ